MKFIDSNHFDMFLRYLRSLGMGSQGVCFLDEKNKIVYKVFHEYFDNEECNYKGEELLRFSNIDNKTFIWPKDIIVVDNQLVGYTMSYVASRSLYEINPLLINLNNFESAIERCSSDIELLTNKGITLYDVMYNILYGNNKINIIDTMEYGSGGATLDRNMKAFNYEVKLFLVDNYFNSFVQSNKMLSDMYISDAGCLEFLKLFRRELSNTLEEDIVNLSQAKSLVKKNTKSKYIRSLNWNDRYE